MTFSTSNAPDSSPANAKPNDVIIGFTAFRKTCLNIIAFSESPFARAVVTNSAFE